MIYSFIYGCLCIFPPVVFRVNSWLSLPPCLSLSFFAHSGRLPLRVGLGARDAAPRPGGEGPQGTRAHQLTAPSARRQAWTADILPLRMCPVLQPSGLVPAWLCFVSGASIASACSRPCHVPRRHGGSAWMTLGSIRFPRPRLHWLVSVWYGFWAFSQAR